MAGALRRSLLVVIPLALTLGACELPTSSPVAGFSAGIADPADGAVVQVGSDVFVDPYGQSSGAAITHLDAYANGVWIGGAGSADFITSSSGVDAEVDWTPGAVGEYLLQASAMRRGGMIISAPVRVCVVDFEIDAGTTYYSSYGYEGECPIPPRDSAAHPGAITLATNVTPDHVIYIPPGADGVIPGTYPGCTPERTLHFQATVIDPPEDVALVIIHLLLPSGPGSSPGYSGAGDLTSTFVLAQTAAYAGSVRIFEGSTDPRPNPGFVFGDVGGTITWTAQAIGRDGSGIVTDGPHTIPASPCAPLVPLSAPFTPTATTTATSPTPTLTPEPTACPPGTYLGPNTGKCIQIYLTPTPKPLTCKSYHDPASCTSNGCSWDPQMQRCSR
jgi:hypothetical protein